MSEDLFTFHIEHWHKGTPAEVARLVIFEREEWAPGKFSKTVRDILEHSSMSKLKTFAWLVRKDLFKDKSEFNAKWKQALEELDERENPKPPALIFHHAV